MNITARATRKVAVLLVEENVPCARLHQAYLSSLKSYQFDVTHVQTGFEALNTIQLNKFDLVLMNLQFRDLGGLELFEALLPHMTETACLILSETGSLNLAVDIMRKGAKDFIVKPVSQAKLCDAVKCALSEEKPQHKKHKNDILQEAPHIKGGFSTFIGNSLEMQQVYKTIQQAAPSQAPVFITGESGTGKELCAEAVHKNSPRADKPFIALNCSAIPRELIESEIFGHEKGAFTGAHKAHIGAAELADGGVLFLDEICEMDLSLQAKLLRFIQTGEIKPVGAAQPKKVDVRFVCATNKDPETCVAKGEFREDLYYRLHVLPISLPPLRKRGDDALLIAERMLESFMKEEAKSYNGFSVEARKMIRTYNWPGNVRQLLNVMRHVVVMNNGGEISADMLGAIRPLEADISAEKHVTFDLSSHITSNQKLGTSSIKPLWEAERDIIENAILECGGNVVEAAHYLQISPSTIYRKRQSWLPQMGGTAAQAQALTH